MDCLYLDTSGIQGKHQYIYPIYRNMQYKVIVCLAAAWKYRYINRQFIKSPYSSYQGKTIVFLI